MIYLYLFGTCFHFIYVFMIIYELLSIGRNYISISRDGKSSSIELDDMPFEKGKYYYFNDISNSFDIPPMEAGK